MRSSLSLRHRVHHRKVALEALKADPSISRRPFSDLIKEATGTAARRFAECEELLTAAYLRETDIPASECEVVMELTPGGYRVFFRRMVHP